jgi:large subunit ribosomal protein L22
MSPARARKDVVKKEPVREATVKPAGGRPARLVQGMRRNEMAVSSATLRHHRGSSQKARLVVDQIRGKNVNQALTILRHSPKTASRAIEKLLRSAVANAESGEERVDADTLRVGEAQVGPGPSLKRFRGRAFGRAFQILHRTCHITLRLVGPIPKETPAAKTSGKRSRAAKTAPAGS